MASWSEEQQLGELCPLGEAGCVTGTSTYTDNDPWCVSIIPVFVVNVYDRYQWIVHAYTFRH